MREDHGRVECAAIHASVMLIGLFWSFQSAYKYGACDFYQMLFSLLGVLARLFDQK